MKNIGEFVSSTKKYKKSIVQQEFKSKKNKVAYVTLKGKPRVLKCFVPGFKRQMNTEYNILKKGGNKLNIPTVFEMDEKNNALVTNYIMGENLCDIINDEKTTKSEKQRLIILLSEWFYDFHNYFKKDNEFTIRGDSSLRNFVLTDRIWGLDFEEARKGKPIEDLAGMCASILTTDPMFTKEKYKLCRLLLENYNDRAPGRISNADEEISYALLEKIQWRPEDEEILRKHSKRIRENGL